MTALSIAKRFCLSRGRLVTFGRDQRATSAVEFGIVAGPLVFSLLGILQVSFYYFAQAALDKGVLRTGQMLYTGFRTGTTPYTPNATTLKAAVVSNSGGLVTNNSTLAVEIQPIANLSAGTVAITDGINNYGTTTSTLVMRAKATIPSFFPLFNSLTGTTSAVIIRRQGT